MGGEVLAFLENIIDRTDSQVFFNTLLFLGFLLSLLVAFVFRKLSDRIGINKWLLSVPSFFCTWGMVNGPLLGGVLGTVLLAVGSVGLAVILISYFVAAVRKQAELPTSENESSPKSRSYPSYTYPQHSPFAPSRDEYNYGSVTCFKCNVLVPKHYVACWNCGTFLNQNYMTKTCVTCGRRLPDHADLCENCGTSLGGSYAWK